MARVTPGAGQLQKRLGRLQFFTLAFGAIIGVGWVVVLGEWLGQAGPVGAILGFVGGAMAMMLVGLCYAEVATLLPVAGGEVAYTYEIFGLQVSYAVGWLLALAYISVTVFEAISVGWMAGALLPGVEGPVLYSSLGEPVRLGGLVLGVGGMALLTYLNFRGARWAASFQDALTLGLILVSLVFVSAGVGWGKVEHVAPLFREGGATAVWGGILSVFMTAPFWFAGFNVIPQVMEEKAPETALRSVGRILVFSIGAAGAFYCLVILAASMAYPWRALLALQLPAAGAFESAFASPLLGKLVLLAAFLGIVTTWNTVFISGSRVLFALGRARMIPWVFGRVHERFGSPAPAVLFVGVLGIVGTLLGRRAIVPIVNLAGGCLAVAFFLTCVGLIRLRRTHPDRPRPYRAPGGAVTAAVAASGAAFMLALSLYQPYAAARGRVPLEWVIFAVWGLLGVASWMLGAGRRGEVSEVERRRLILGGVTAVDVAGGAP